MTREEAIEVYNGLINTKIKEAFEFFAPELREINEEEIRKDIIGGLMWQRDNLKSEGPHDNNLILPGFCLTVGEHLTYLEKQREHSMSAEEVLTRAGLKPYKDGNQWCILAGDNIQEGICGFGDTIEDALYEFLKEVLDLQKEQKPAEKQDYSGLNDLERAIHRGFLCAGVENVPVTIIKETAKECLVQMKPAEWSEDDEKAYNNALDALYYKDCNDKDDLIRALGDLCHLIIEKRKVIPPYAHWKPSEEQMEAFRIYLYNPQYIDNSEDKKIKLVESLYNDLKKLM